jgi:phosphoribosylanthranilate isomerase
VQVKVKICGVRTLDEALIAVEHGADYLGFNLWEGSPRYVEPRKARNIASGLDERVSTVGVFVNETIGRIDELAREIGLSFVQLHGDESPEYYSELDTRLQTSGRTTGIIKAFRAGVEFDPREVVGYPGSIALLDTKVDGRYGGTGKVFDWDVAVETKKYAPLMLAGGLNVKNIAEAIKMVQPFAVDVCSGVEAEPGRKDLNKLREFLAAAHLANYLAALQRLARAVFAGIEKD